MASSIVPGFSRMVLAKSIRSSKFRLRLRTGTESTAFVKGCPAVSDGGDYTLFGLRAGSSSPSRRKIHGLNCVRCRGNIDSPPLVVSSEFRQRAITSIKFGLSAVPPHVYREQGERSQVREVRIPPAAPLLCCETSPERLTPATFDRSRPSDCLVVKYLKLGQSTRCWPETRSSDHRRDPMANVPIRRREAVLFVVE